ncbi:asialoglycoprotein receptor 1 isoform X2 [Osmerus eperlanus]|uniref:asialoglycoprotein receptor 1 isoform X2 n=1 Tax=Osmerus eperlanus TaxID=29151 RepID=UPI002E1115AD
MKELPAGEERTDVMETDYHDDYNPSNSRDDTAFWTKEGAPRLGVLQPSSPPRWRMWVLPSVCAVLLLALIISVSVSNMKTGRRVTSVEKTVANLTSAVQSLHTSLHLSQTAADETQKEIGRLEVSMATGQVKLESVLESVKTLDEVVNLRHKVDGLKCSIDRFLRNDSSVECCPLDWILFSSRCYLLSHDALGWNQARDWCVAHQSQLAVLKTRDEWRFLGQRAHPQYYWIGLTDERTGTWEWVDGTPYTMDRSHWLPNQPDNWVSPERGLTGTEDCAHLHTNGRLNDNHCTRLLRYVCQGHLLVPST